MIEINYNIIDFNLHAKLISFIFYLYNLMSKTQRDWEKSDKAFNEICLPFIKKIYEDKFDKKICKLEKASKDEDINNSIDSWIVFEDGSRTPIQQRVQFAENKKGYFPYSPTIRFSRSKNTNGHEISEFDKIKENIEKSAPYPECLIWALVDTNTHEIKQLYIVNLTKFFNNYANEEYCICFEYKHEIDPISKKKTIVKINPTSKKYILVRENDDDSSEFATLWARHIKDIIIYSYYL